MPSRTRQGPADEAEGDSGLPSLSFNQPLSWRVGRSAIPIADLLERLHTLANELRKLEQEEIEKESLRKVSQELASAHLLAHKDKGVRAWAACCLVDVLRLCAPDAPFTRNQLKDIFTCIVTSIIPALADPSNAYNAQHIYVLGSLAEVKSIVLMTDLDHPDSLIVPLFTGCFDIVSGSSKSSTGEEVAKNVEFDMTRVLVTVIDEMPVLAAEVVDTIVAQFLRVDPRVEDNPRKTKRQDAVLDAKQDTLLLKDYPAAYNMAKAICQACPERMTSHISQYFNNVIIDASAPAAQANGAKHASRKPNLDDSDEEGEDIKELSKAHRLIRELWRACPEVLQNVIPQVEAELSAESIALRLLATQTIGDLAAGVGVAGPPPSAPMDPAAYPAVTLGEYAQLIPQPNVLLMPVSPKPFSHLHSSAYEAFLSRRLDKTPSIRAAWVTVVGRILLTSAGGSGLSEGEEQGLVQNLASMLRDADEKVRLAAVDTVGRFGYTHVVHKLGVNGGCASPDSVLAILAERVKDRKPQVREHAMKILARIWAVASGDIEQNIEPVASLLKDAPSKIFDAFYTNDQEIHVLIDRVLFETLLPLNYPPIKTKLTRTGSNQSQKQKESQPSDAEEDSDVDKIRVRRILTLIRGLDEKARRVFFVMLARQLSMRSAMTLYLEACEKFNGGVIDKDEEQTKARLSSIIESLSKTFPDVSRASADLWKFAKAHDRRSYQLIRFAMAAVSDYRTATKAIRELQRRTQSANNSPIIETVTPLLYRSGSLIFNRSHIPAIMSLSRTDENGLANAAQEMLKQISSQNPEVLEAQVQEMCKDLESQAPKASSPGDTSSEEILKACAGFAKKLPGKLPKERKFYQALSNYALYSTSPHAAKHAVSILMATSDRKEMYAKDLVQKCVKKWTYGSDHFLARLATLSQLNLLVPRQADEETGEIISIAINQVLLTNRNPQGGSDYTWSDTMDEETQAKEWALKIIVNRLRAQDGSDNEDDFRAHAEPVYDTLNKLVAGEGELSKKKDTPANQKSRLRLLAAKSLVKLCASSTLCDHLLTPIDFNALGLMAQDPLLPVRSGFMNYLKKKLVQRSHLGFRWYIVPCLLAFEPSITLKESTLTWLRSRAVFFSQQAQASGKRTEQTMVMELVFSRLLSLLAYHPDYPSDDLGETTKLGDLSDFSRYIVFYLSAVANEHNLSLIFHVAQRVKQFRDGITKSDQISTRLHTLSDLAQATIRRFADIYSQQHKVGGGNGGTNLLQTYPGKMGVPSSLFANMGSHQEAQEVADKNFLPDELDDMLDRVVRTAMKPKSGSHSAHGSGKKRKPESSAPNRSESAKKARKEKPARTPRKSSSVGVSGKTSQRKRKGDDGWSSDVGGESVSTSNRRRSSRGTARVSVSYADKDSDEDDEEMQGWAQDKKDDNAELEESEEEDEADEDGAGDGDEDEEMQDEESENADQEEDEEQVELEQASEKENSPPTPPVRSARGKKTPESKPSRGKKPEKPVTTTLPTRRSSRRG
ncbi:Armadillo-like helical [Penicillium angulare]|uniref:Armadillo-like helical n=1 Tax=Penicillium angulare TaxID=116970 RepID=UPI002541AFCB|nr:Armadillo-like helical [Penicillium angulare]KAJ5256976.1 Armadillo-like helical [Penicillium angulare]